MVINSVMFADTEATTFLASLYWSSYRLTGSAYRIQVTFLLNRFQGLVWKGCYQGRVISNELVVVG